MDNADENIAAWSKAHVADHAFYAVQNVDRGYFINHMRSPLIQSIVSLSKAHGRKFKILEIGSGSGVISVCLALRGHTVTTVDVSRHLLAQAGELANTAARLFPKRPLNISFRQGDIFDPDTYSGEYDVVLCNNVIIIWKERAKHIEAITKLRSVLNSQGWLVLGTTNTMNPLFKLIPVKDIVADLAEHNLAILEEEVTEAGFRVVQRGALGISEHFNQWLSAVWISPLLKFANFGFELLPDLVKLPVAPHVFVVAQKC